jgi:hypothetical protein
VALRWTLIEATRADQNANCIVRYTWGNAPTVEVGRTSFNLHIGEKDRATVRADLDKVASDYGLFVANAIDRVEDLQGWIGNDHNIPGT